MRKPHRTKPRRSAGSIAGNVFLTQQNDINDVQTLLRNMLSHARIYAIPSKNSISIHGSPEDVALARKIIAEFDHPRMVYRITYTFTDKDSDKQAGTQTIALVAASGEKTQSHAPPKAARDGCRASSSTSPNPAKQICFFIGNAISLFRVRRRETATVNLSSTALSKT